MRCEFCQRITVDAANGSTRKEEIELLLKPQPRRKSRRKPRIQPHKQPRGQPHHPGFAALRNSADRGCSLCSVFKEAFLQSWDMDIYWRLGALGFPSKLMVRSDVYCSGLVPTSEFCDVVSHLTVELIFGIEDPEIRIENPYVTFQVFTTPDDNAAKDKRIIGRPLHQDTDKAISFHAEPLQQCLAHHFGCQNKGPQQLPSRVIDVGAGDGSVQPKLVVPGTGLERYVTLSYCWGAAIPLTTTKATLQDRMERIPLATMPQTFVDAVQVTRHFGIRYLWIDALCIIQDSEDDWKVESEKMDEVYSRSLFTIAATMATDCHQGFLKVRDINYFQTLAELDHHMSGHQSSGKIYLRRDYDSWQRSVSNSHLAQRAWTLQEAMLSNRIMYFGDLQSFWQCSEVSISQGSTDPTRTITSGLNDRNPETKELYRTGFQNSLLGDWKWRGDFMERLRAVQSEGFFPPENEYMKCWYECLEEYTARAMTKPGDKLPAIAGLAKAFSTTLESDANYLEGLWSNDFLRGLLWRPVYDGANTRPENYRAPTWSWASVDGPIVIPIDDLDRYDEDHRSLSFDLAVVSLAAGDPGKIGQHIMQLKTRARSSMYLHLATTPTSLHHRSHVIDGSTAMHYHTYTLYEPIDESPTSWQSIAKCWFDETPVTDPATPYMLIDLVEIGRWAPRYSYQAIKQRDAENALSLLQNLDGNSRPSMKQNPSESYHIWALMVKRVPNDVGDPSPNMNKVERIGVARMVSPTAFDEWPTVVVQVY